MKTYLLPLFVSLTVTAAPAVAEPPEFAPVKRILDEQCCDCHNSATSEGGLNLRRFDSYGDTLQDRAVWKRVLDVVESRQMPLDDSGYELTSDDREVLLRYVAELQAQPDPGLQAVDPGKAILRRLTRLEYNNTVRDLFGLNYDIFMFPERLPVADKRYLLQSKEASLGNRLQTSMREYGQKYDVLLPLQGLPGDNRAEYGFANRGDSLNFSPLLLEKYLELAHAIACSERLERESPVMAGLLGRTWAPPASPATRSTDDGIVSAPVARKFTANDSIAGQANGNEAWMAIRIDPSLPLSARLAQFLRLSYRREVSEAELAAVLNLVRQSVDAGVSEPDAIRLAVQSVLASPAFLFLSEPFDAKAGAVRPLNDFELAGRLSYFLWSSMPDDELLSLAALGELAQTDTLRKQIRRMLQNRRKSRELSESFAVQWLKLDQLYSSKPDRRLFKDFYSGPQGKSTLHGAMLTEPLLLFETVLVEDRSVLDVCDPGFTWLNKQLADLYGLQVSFHETRRSLGEPATAPDEKNVERNWYRVSLPDRSRGGVMTMAGPLMLTSLPFRTSPVKRGAWLLETIFNRPPAEPKVAFVLDENRPDRGNDLAEWSVRQRFEQHRSDPNCYSCHRRIDPAGFSLETFDAIGKLRTHDGTQRVDASGVWNETAFNGPAEFKAALRKREHEFVRGFVEHLMSYALGRPIEHFDLPAITKIVDEAAADGYRLSRIVEGIALSYPFQHTRNVQRKEP